LKIPDFLRRTNPSKGVADMTQPVKKTRKVTELPTAFGDGTVIADLSLAELVEKKAIWEEAIASHGKQQLELRAIRAAIRSKA
jgi:hypothetical protein